MFASAIEQSNDQSDTLGREQDIVETIFIVRFNVLWDTVYKTCAKQLHSWTSSKLLFDTCDIVDSWKKVLETLRLVTVLVGLTNIYILRLSFQRRTDDNLAYRTHIVFYGH